MDKRAVIKRKSGLTLLELVLAMSVLAIIVTGSSAMSLMAARLGNRAAAHSGLDYQLAYAQGVLKKDIDGSSSLKLAVTTGPVYTLTILPAGGTSPTDDIVHIINLTAKTWTRTQSGVPEALTLQGIISQGPFVDNDNTLLAAVWLTASKKVLYLNLTASKTNQMTSHTVEAPAYMKAYFVGPWITVTG